MAFELKLPILGICRGFQLLNVYLGGSLYQDLKTQTDVSISHRNAELYDTIHHSVNLKEESLIKSIYKENSLEVNTVHHQRVKLLEKIFIRPCAKKIKSLKLLNSIQKITLFMDSVASRIFSYDKEKLNSHQPLTDYFVKK